MGMLMNGLEAALVRNKGNKRIKGKRSWKYTLKTTAKVVGAVALLGIAAGIIFFITLINDTQWKSFDPSKLENQAQSLLLYDKDGKEAGGMSAGQNRIVIPLEQIPKKVQEALIATEDTRFYSHHGVDITRIFGALWADIRSGSKAEGASTIDQQLIKLTHLTNEKTWTRKLQEARLAIELERHYSKDQILEMYLNTVYFGHGAYGIEAAAQTYFGKSASKLTTAEGALLIGVLKSPGLYAPHLHLDRSTERRDLILGLMNKYGYLTEDEMKKAQAEKVNLKLTDLNTDAHGYFMDAAVEEAMAILNIDYETLVSSGYRIYTSMDTKLQAQCEKLMADKDSFPPNAKDGTKVEGALLVLDSKTGAARAVVGGREYTARMGLNRATDARRQPGSTIKPALVYGPAIDRYGYNPATPILDEPVDFNGYKPENSGGNFHGWVTMRQALTNSINIPAVKILNDVGLTTAKDFAGRLGIPFDKQDNSLAIALGGFTQGVTPMELASAYTAFPNGGRYSKGSLVSKIVDADGKVLYQNPYGNVLAMSDSTAYLVTSMLQDAATVGTAKLLGGSKMPVAAKTGTVAWKENKNRDLWLAGFNPDYVVVAWEGFDTTDNSHYLAGSTSGGKYPAKIAKGVFDYLYKDKEAPKFVVPDSVTMVALDKKALQDTQQIVLASSLTPEEYKLYEYFPKNAVPTTESSYWQTPVPPTGFNLTLSANNYPVASFLIAQDFARYDLYRVDTFGNTAKITEITGQVGKTSSFEDVTATPGTWQYYVLPVQPEINVTGDSTEALSITVPAPEPTSTPDTGWSFPWPFGNTEPSPTPADTGAFAPVTPSPEATATAPA